MIDPKLFCAALAQRRISFYAGVPDSLLSSLCTYLADNYADTKHIVTANEGSAIGIASGHYLATGNPAAVYMQNSGFGNALNPLLSLADPEVYKIPMLLIIGWRGEPGTKDEPQHVKQGKVQTRLLEAAEIPYAVMDGSEDIDAVLDSLPIKEQPVALLIKKGSFTEYAKAKTTCEYSLMREEAIEIILHDLPGYSIVSTTGKTSRELFEIRQKRQEEPCDFLTVGSMGHSSSIALGIALAKPDKKIICLDGDGAMLMHLGTLATIGKLAPKNFVHILLNNRCHESVGGQNTAADILDFAALAKGAHYMHYYSANDQRSLRDALFCIPWLEGPVLLEVKLKPGSRKDLGRPKSSPEENKQSFMQHLSKG